MSQTNDDNFFEKSCVFLLTFSFDMYIYLEDVKETYSVS